MDAEALLNGSPHAVLVLDHLPNVIYANASAIRLLDAGSVLGMSLEDLMGLISEGHRPRAQRLLDGVRAGRRGGPIRLRLESEEQRWVSVTAAPVAGGGAQLAMVDISDRARADQRLRRSELRFRAAFEASPTSMALVDEDGLFLRVNRALAELTGRPMEWFPGRNADEVNPPEDVLGNVVANRRLGGHGDPVRLARRYQRPDGSVRYGLLTAVRVQGDDGRALMLAQIEDVTERRQVEERLQRLALHDALTDLPGRGLLLDRLEEALGNSPSVAVLFVDLDGFKLVNDALGHATGDAVLIEIARRLSASVRPSDVVGRLGGDEFLVVCRDLGSHEEALEVARRIESAVSRPIPRGRDEVLISASVGVAFSETSGVSPADLVRDADTAMYRAKELGKKRFEVFDEAMRERAHERNRVERLLRSMVAENRLVVHYQPIVELQTGLVVAVEALARLRDEDGSLLLPTDFLDVAEDNALVATLDDAVFDQGIAQVARWRAELGYDLALAVNLSAARITADLPDRVLSGLAAVNLPPKRLVLEITEQTLVDRGPASEQTLVELHDAGVRLAIDDFGTGWASLTYLRRFPVDLVKVDRSFVAGLNDERQDQVIVRAVVDLSSQLGLGCTAEGVETASQHQALLEMGAHHGQGHLYGRPVAAEDLPALLTGRNVRR